MERLKFSPIRKIEAVEAVNDNESPEAHLERLETELRRCYDDLKTGGSFESTTRSQEADAWKKEYQDLLVADPALSVQVLAKNIAQQESKGTFEYELYQLANEAVAVRGRMLEMHAA